MRIKQECVHSTQMLHPLTLSFSMLIGLCSWGQNSNLVLKLERSYHREHVY